MNGKCFRGERENILKEGTTLDWVEVGGRWQGQRQISVANLIMIIIITTITITITTIAITIITNININITIITTTSPLPSLPCTRTKKQPMY